MFNHVCTCQTVFPSGHTIIQFTVLYEDLHDGFPGGSVIKEFACSVGDLGLIPVLGRTPGEGNSRPLQYSSLKNSMDRGAWWATVLEVGKSWTALTHFHF